MGIRDVHSSAWKRKENKLSASYESEAYIDSDYSTRENPDWPDQLSSPDNYHKDPNPQEQSEAMESVPTATPRRSGRVSRPLTALEDYVLE